MIDFNRAIELIRRNGGALSQTAMIHHTIEHIL